MSQERNKSKVDDKPSTRSSCDNLVSESEFMKLKKELDLITRLLCALCKKLEADSLGGLIPNVENGELETWWEAHKKFDKERLKKAKASGLAKLTDEEKEALELK